MREAGSPMMATGLLDDLTAAQREAVTHADGPLLVLAGPGSGKTRVITRRVAFLMEQGVRPWNILAITFTNKAAGEMRERVESLAPGATVWISTFHSFCGRMLRRYADRVGLGPNFSIYDTDDRLRLIKKVLAELEFDSTRFSPSGLEREISRAKNDLVDPDLYRREARDFFQQVVAQVYHRYQQRITEQIAADFDDLLCHMAKLLREHPDVRNELNERFRYVLVDEYQDTNRPQYEIARGLSVGHSNLCVTGDPDQSIYGWRGANLNNLLGFEQDFPSAKVVRLEQNYRSTQHILRVADRLIRFNRRRKHKELFTENPQGQRVAVTAAADGMVEAMGVARRIREA